MLPEEEVSQASETPAVSTETPAASTPSEPPSRRDAIEQAFEQAEAAAKPKDESPAATEQKPEAQAQAAPVVQEQPVQTQADDAPKSWRAAARGKWAGLDPDVKKEIARREQDTAKVFGEASQARNFVNQFADVVRPYEARLRTENVNPIQAVQRLLQADYILASSAPAKAAQFMAQLIKEYSIDIKELDNALAGQPAADPVQSAVDQLLQQRLAPINQFLQQQQLQQQAVDQQRGRAAQTEVEAMARDTAKYPHFDEVRETMADLVDFFAAKGVYEPLDKIYAKAVAMNPSLSALQVQQSARQQASASTAQANKALAASASVAGSPSGSPVVVKSTGSLRDAVEAAFAAHSGR